MSAARRRRRRRKGKEVVKPRRAPPCLWEFAENGELDSLKALVDKEAIDINSKNRCAYCSSLETESESRDPFNSLRSAARSGHLGIVEYLICKKASVNDKSLAGECGLHTASYNGHFTVVDVLCKAGAFVNAEGYLGCSPLHEASRKSRELTVQKLLRAGANPLQENSDGKTAREVAHTKEIREILYEAERVANKTLALKEGDSPALETADYGESEVLASFDERLQRTDMEMDLSEVSEEKTSQLVSMGFEREAAVLALGSTGNSVADALSSLLAEDGDT